MLDFSKDMRVRRSWAIALVVLSVAMLSPQVFAEVGVDEADVGVLEDVAVSDVEGDVDETEDISDLDVEDDVEDEDISELDAEEGDVASESDAGGEANDAEEPEPEFLLVSLQVEVLFDEDAPAIVTLGLSGHSGTVESEEVPVSEGQAFWEIEELRAGSWTLSAFADGYEPVSYRFVAGDSSQMTVRVSMLELGRVPDVKVESGWGCSAVAADAMPSMLILFSAFAGGRLVLRRRRRR